MGGRRITTGEDQRFSDGQRQINQGDAQRPGYCLDHLAGRFLEAPLDFGEVLRRQSGPACNLAQREAAVMPKPPQQLPEDLPPQRLPGFEGVLPAGPLPSGRAARSRWTLNSTDVGHA